MRRGRQAGFTLVEVVVAFVLLAAVLTTVIEIFSRGLARASEMENEARALVIAQSKLAAAGVEEPLAEGEARGESEDRTHRWSLTVQRSPESDLPNVTGRTVPMGYTLYRVEARVGWAAATGAERNVSLATLLIAQNK